MMLGALLASILVPSAPAAEGECTFVGFGDVVAPSAPAVLVLGERHGFGRDLGRAMRVALRLSADAPVTLALEAVHRDKQAVLDAFAAGKVDEDDLPARLDWDRTWGFAWGAYRSLVTASEEGIRVVGVGLDLGPMPEGASVPVPSNYLDLLRPAMGGHEVPIDQEQRFVSSMAWRDHALARGAVEAWDGKGYLVIVVGRGHVEGGKGTAWQARMLTKAPVEATVLAPGPNPPCHPGDRLWR